MSFEKLGVESSTAGAKRHGVSGDGRGRKKKKKGKIRRGKRDIQLGEERLFRGEK